MAKSFHTPAAFKAALEARMRGRAAERGIPLQTVQLKFVMERLLARLFHAPDPPWLLKGGFRHGPPLPAQGEDHEGPRPVGAAPGARGWRGTSASGCKTPRPPTSATSSPSASGEHPGRADELRPGGGGRFPCEALLVGKTYARFHLDVGVGDAVVGVPERLTGDDLLAFAGIAPAVALCRADRPAVRREGPRLHLPVGGADQHADEGPGRHGPPPRTRAAGRR